MITLEICPYLEYSFQILGRKWNGLIIHYLSLYANGAAQFSDIKRDVPDITPRALSLKLTELIEFDLIEKIVISSSPVTILYQLTEKGRALTNALGPLQQWAQDYQK